MSGFAPPGGTGDPAGPSDPASRPLEGHRLDAPHGDVVAGWRDEGFVDDLEVAAGGAISCGCGEVHEPDAFTVVHQYRYEGTTNPGDEQISLAAEAPCGRRGSLTVAYGPYATADEAEACRRLPPPTD